MKKLLPLLFLLHCVNGIAQAELATYQIKELSSTYGENWEYFELEETIEVRILLHLPAFTICHIQPVGSLSFVETIDGQVFRILDMCNNVDIPKNKLVTIIPTTKFSSSVLLPIRKFIHPQTGKIEQYELDKNTIRTTFVHIETEW